MKFLSQFLIPPFLFIALISEDLKKTMTGQSILYKELLNPLSPTLLVCIPIGGNDQIIIPGLRLNEKQF